MPIKIPPCWCTVNKLKQKMTPTMRLTEIQYTVTGNTEAQLSQKNHVTHVIFGNVLMHNKAFIDIRLRPGIATPLAVVSQSLRPNVTSSIKLEVHNISQHRQRKTEPRPQGICTKNIAKIDPAVPEICSWIDRHTQTERQTHRQTN